MAMAEAMLKLQRSYGGMCGKGLDFFLIKLLCKATNCNINGIFNYYPDFSISSFNSCCPIRDNVSYMTENFYYMAESLNDMLLHT